MQHNEELRLECLRLAVVAQPCNAVIEARRFYDFIKGVERDAAIKTAKDALNTLR